MSDKELEEYIKTIEPNFDSHLEKGTIEMSNEYYNLLEERMARLINENQELKQQLDYLRSGEYYNQLRFENEMLQQVVDTNGVPSEVYDYIDCTHRNTELLKENQELKLELSGYRQAILENKDMLGLKEESEELKKQLTTYKILHRDCKVDNLKNISKIEEMENQQKEFIKWLEDYLKLFDKMDIDAKISYDMFEEILQKYKSIIGDDK